MKENQEESWKRKFKHLVMTGESTANEKRKSEIAPKVEMADKTYRVILFFFILIFWIVLIVRYVM